MSIKLAIEAARKAVSFRRESAEQEQARLNQEVSILQQFESHQQRLAESKAGVAAVKSKLDELSDGDCAPSLAFAFTNGSATDGVILGLATQVAARECLRKYKTEILAAYKRITIEASEANLSEFIKEHSEVLRRHGAL
jgi:hypothetical protein